MNNPSPSDTSAQELLVAALYRFTDIGDPVTTRLRILQYGQDNKLCGTILVAPEGINGTVAGAPQAVTSFLQTLETAEGMENLQVRYSNCESPPFKRWRVRLKKEIVTMGVEGTNPRTRVGTYVKPEKWNQLLEKENITLIDTRNYYEIKVGKFTGAIDPGTENFREFPDWVDKNLDPEKTEKVAMYCTGGIRCEKATHLLLSKGFKEVYHLEGGILRYLEETPASESTWEGECFVFDERIAVDHSLQPGTHVLCEQCQLPIPASEIEEHRCGKPKRAKQIDPEL